MYKDARQLCSKNETDDSGNDAGELPSQDALGSSDNEEDSDDGGDSDGMYNDRDVLEAFQNELAADDDKDDEEWGAEASATATQADAKVQPDDEHEWRPGKFWNTRERTKACLDRLKKGPDGRYTNVVEVATEVDMLLASFLKLRKADDPDHAENSDDDEKYLEGVDIKKFKRLQRQVRDGTYKFQPVVVLPLGKKKIVKLKKKKVKKGHPF
ncbi:hypothetical protein L7F22_015364 [Adiantum nelumboides]|nr:hypothetical protein [Adiantum nelumboides]MCO5561740.1 hypothetical protein [Adiantum nelumboides]MCO5561741.1 hypothetical protein [Adiantum nelumboides]